MVMAMSEIKIYSKFGEITGEPMALVDIKKSILPTNTLATAASDPAQDEDPIASDTTEQ